MARIKPQTLLQQSKKKKAPSSVSIPTIAVYVLVVVASVFFFSATYRHWKKRSLLQTDGSISLVEEGDKATANTNRHSRPKYTVLKTSKGTIIVELYKEGSPEVVDEFVESCKKGHFRGMEFNRVIKHFVIQGGDVEGPGATEDWTAKGKHYGQLDTSLKHEAFMLGTSKARHNHGGFDLIITTAPIPDLNQKINVFGRVVKGEDVVQVPYRPGREKTP